MRRASGRSVPATYSPTYSIVEETQLSKSYLVHINPQLMHYEKTLINGVFLMDYLVVLMAQSMIAQMGEIALFTEKVKKSDRRMDNKQNLFFVVA